MLQIKMSTARMRYEEEGVLSRHPRSSSACCGAGCGPQNVRAAVGGQCEELLGRPGEHLRHISQVSCFSCSWWCLVMIIAAGASSTYEDEACVTAATDGSLLRAKHFLAHSAGVVQACSQAPDMASPLSHAELACCKDGAVSRAGRCEIAGAAGLVQVLKAPGLALVDESCSNVGVNYVKKVAWCRDSAVRSCWPLRAMPELLGKRKWSMVQDMSYRQRVLLDAKLANSAGLEPDECRAIAAELGLAFQQVGMQFMISVPSPQAADNRIRRSMMQCMTTLYFPHLTP